MKKIIMLVTILLVLTGCTAKYSITINEDLTVIEEASLAGTSEFYETYYKSTKKNVLKMLIDSYKDILDANNYEYKLVEEEEPFVKVQNKYDNVRDYIEKTILFNDYFDTVKYIEDGNIKKIETEGYYPNNPEDPNRFDIKELEISITCPYKVINNNAKRVNKKTNTYYFDLFKDNKIIFEYDSSKKFDPNEGVLVKLLIILGIVVVGWLTVIMKNKKNK